MFYMSTPLEANGRSFGPLLAPDGVVSGGARPFILRTGNVAGLMAPDYEHPERGLSKGMAQRLSAEREQRRLANPLQRMMTGLEAIYKHNQQQENPNPFVDQNLFNLAWNVMAFQKSWQKTVVNMAGHLPPNRRDPRLEYQFLAAASLSSSTMKAIPFDFDRDSVSVDGDIPYPEAFGYLIQYLGSPSGMDPRVGSSEEDRHRAYRHLNNVANRHGKEENYTWFTNLPGVYLLYAGDYYRNGSFMFHPEALRQAVFAPEVTMFPNYPQYKDLQRWREVNPRAYQKYFAARAVPDDLYDEEMNPAFLDMTDTRPLVYALTQPEIDRRLVERQRGQELVTVLHQMAA
jgi:hypothetical protein